MIIFFSLRRTFITNFSSWYNWTKSSPFNYITYLHCKLQLFNHNEQNNLQCDKQSLFIETFTLLWQFPWRKPNAAAWSFLFFRSNWAEKEGGHVKFPNWLIFCLLRKTTIRQSHRNEKLFFYHNGNNWKNGNGRTQKVYANKETKKKRIFAKCLIIIPFFLILCHFSSSSCHLGSARSWCWAALWSHASITSRLCKISIMVQGFRGNSNVQLRF